jgi:hypothetical protein
MSSFGASGVSALKEFASSGGTIVTISGASVFAALKDVGLDIDESSVGSDDDDQKGKGRDSKEPKPSPSPSASPKPEPTPADLGSNERNASPQSLPPIASPSATPTKCPKRCPGAIFRATVDRTTYLNYGVNRDEIPVLLASGYFLRYSKEGTNALVFDADPKTPITLSGFVWEGNTERLLKGTSYVIDESSGLGAMLSFLPKIRSSAG